MKFKVGETVRSSTSSLLISRGELIRIEDIDPHCEENLPYRVTNDHGRSFWLSEDDMEAIDPRFVSASNRSLLDALTDALDSKDKRIEELENKLKQIEELLK